MSLSVEVLLTVHALETHTYEPYYKDRNLWPFLILRRNKRDRLEIWTQL